MNSGNMILDAILLQTEKLTELNDNIKKLQTTMDKIEENTKNA